MKPALFPFDVFFCSTISSADIVKNCDLHNLSITASRVFTRSSDHRFSAVNFCLGTIRHSGRQNPMNGGLR